MAFPTDPIYKFVETTFDGVTSTHVMKAESNILIHIPFKEGNRDYKEYLEWAKTNTAEAAD
tara:strand:- start:79 stop:261 length:183 start_codon:yes stop_codon:yes gene_type:complete